MTRLASRFGQVNSVRRDRPLTQDELAYYVPSVASAEVGVPHCQLPGLSLVLHPQQLPRHARLSHLGVEVKQIRHHPP